MLKKAVIFLFLTIAVNHVAFTQKSIEFGLILGRGYYLGEVNPKTHVGNGVGSFAVGAVGRYNLNERYTLKATYIRTKLKGEDKSTEFLFNQQRLASFETKLSELSTSIEFNFLPYKTGVKGKIFTPYLFVGLSYFTYNPTTTVEGFINENIVDDSKGNGLAYLFGPGLKLSMNRKLALGFEWGFRKTGEDLLDGLENRIGDTYETGKPYDNDWFIISAFTLTYKITNEGPCPAYNF